MKAIEFGGWRIDTSQLTEKQAEALALAANQNSVKESARVLGISPTGVQQRLDDARFKLGMQRSVRGLIVEAFRRGIIAPLAIVMMFDGYMTQAQPVRRPERPRTHMQVRIVRPEHLLLA